MQINDDAEMVPFCGYDGKIDLGCIKWYAGCHINWKGVWLLQYIGKYDFGPIMAIWPHNIKFCFRNLYFLLILFFIP